MRYDDDDLMGFFLVSLGLFLDLDREGWVKGMIV